MDESVTGRWAKDKELFTRYIQEQGAEVICMAAEMDMEKQYQLAQEMLDMDIDVLVLVPTDMNEAAKIVLLAHKRAFGLFPTIGLPKTVVWTITFLSTM